MNHCECAICGEHYGDKSATWIQCNSCDDWFDHECAGISDEQLQDEYLCDLYIISCTMLDVSCR